MLLQNEVQYRKKLSGLIKKELHPDKKLLIIYQFILVVSNRHTKAHTFTSTQILTQSQLAKELTAFNTANSFGNKNNCI